jgi:hypothetical protein
MFFDKHSPAGPFTGPAAARNAYQGRYPVFDGHFVPASEISGRRREAAFGVSGRGYG